MTIFAKSLNDDDNNTNDLHTYSIIDPQSVNGSSITYKVYAGNYGDIVFDHWSDGSKERSREFAVSEPTTVTAFYLHG